mmetsp:Transcript_18577/g.47749  ORF Transcript_18577/g.47749 Transcript_18577/m.47749 type:complete len:210 (+) Transcript_18577:89-718(+)
MYARRPGRSAAQLETQRNSQAFTATPRRHPQGQASRHGRIWRLRRRGVIPQLPLARDGDEAAPAAPVGRGAHGFMSYSPSSSSNSPSSSAVASWYCWYSETRSFMLLSASVNSISSMPSPVYQCRKALRRNIDVKYSATRLNISWIAVELPAKATAIFRPFGGMSQIEALMLFGIHSTKYEEFLFCTFSICSSTSFVDMRPRKSAAAVR